MGKIFGDRLRSRRKKLALSGAVVSHEIGTSPSSYYRIERGVREPSEDVVAKLAVSLAFPASSLQALADMDRLGEERSRARQRLANDPTAIAGNYRSPDEPLTSAEIGRLFEAIGCARDLSEQLHLLKALRPGILAGLRSALLSPGPIPPAVRRFYGEDPVEPV